MDERYDGIGNEEQQKREPQPESPVRARDAWHARTEQKQRFGKGQGQAGAQNERFYGSKPPKRKKPKKPMAIFGSILAGVLILGIFASAVGIGGSGNDTNVNDAAGIRENYIGVLYVDGTIGEDSATYNQQYLLDSLDGMMSNDSNKGLMLYVNTPGGTVSDIDELYLKIKDYQDSTKRPVYVYMDDQATSGGYYISASADKIMANRNCWTGSIGVIVGTLYDVSGLLDRYGIKAENITSGANKAMGSSTEALTDEQRQILQSMVDEAYEQFVGVVAEGRDLSTEYVKSVSDGRIYTAKQAKELDLVDQVVNTYDDAREDMMEEQELWDCEFYEFQYWEEAGLLDLLVQGVSQLSDSIRGESDIDALTELMEDQQDVTIEYRSELVK